MEVKIPEELKKKFPDTSITNKDGHVRILCSSRPIYSAETVEKVAKELTNLNPHFVRFSFTTGTDRHGRREGNLIFKEK